MPLRTCNFCTSKFTVCPGGAMDSAGGAHSGNSQSTFQGCLDRLAIANPCYERGVAYINATAATRSHRLTRLIPLKPEVRSNSG